MNVFVTGASGFVGRYLCDHMEALRWRVTRASRRSLPGHAPIDHAFVSVEQQVKAVGLSDVVFHLAGRAHRTSGEDPSLFHRDNFETTKRVFEAAVRVEARQFVFVSTVRVLGETSSRPFAPSDVRRPGDAYSRSKAEAEEWLEAQRGRGIAITIVRPPLVYGPGVRANFLYLLNAVGYRIPLPFARADAPRSQIARANLAGLLVACVRDKAPDLEVLHCRDDKDYSISELVRELADLMGRRALLFPAPVGMIDRVARLAGMKAASRLFESAQVDDSHTRATLDWHPRVPSRDALNETVAWWRTR